MMIGAVAKILGRIETGTMSNVAASSGVLKDFPPQYTVGGIPAQIVRRHDQNEMPAVAMDQNL